MLQDPEGGHPGDFWLNYRPERDPYTKMLDHVAYGQFFIAAVPRMDDVQVLPRFELLLPNDGWSENDEFPRAVVQIHLERTLQAIKQDGFDVAKEHSMFDDNSKLDVLPASLVLAHERVKSWANDLIIRAQEYVGLAVSDFLGLRRQARARLKPLTKDELQAVATQMQRQRDDIGGGSPRA